MPSIDKAYKWAITWCNKPKVGYSKQYRNKKVVRGITYFDCSSFINYALVAGGFKTPSYAPSHNAFTTATMGAELLRLGFTQYTATSSFEWKAGDIGVNPNEHTEMCYKGGTGKAIFMGAHTSRVTLANQVSIGSSNGNSSYRRTFSLCYRYKSDGAVDNGFSMYVISAICGNFWQESGVNPGVWQNLHEPSATTTAYSENWTQKEYSQGARVNWNGHNYTAKKNVPVSVKKDDKTEYIYPSNSEYWRDDGAWVTYSKWEQLNVGFGLGQWTNTGGDRHGRLYNLHKYSADHGGDGSMEAQAKYIIEENVWHKGTSYQQSVPYNSLSEFIHSDSTDIDELTKAWLYCWEGIDNGTLSERQAHAKKVYEYLLDHEGDESTSYESSNTYLSDSQRLQNSLALFNLFGGVVIHDGEKHRKVRKMPVWMMIRYHY